MLEKNNKKNIFLVAGRTGGPYFPIPKIISVLDQSNPIIIGVKNSFEERICKTEKLELVYLPEAKLNFLSFSKSNLADKLFGITDLIWNLIKFKFSFWICIFQLLRYQPKLIYTTGSFLAVPLFFVAKVLNFLRLSNIKLVVHQQDPLVGLSNRICVKMADLRSSTFDYTKNNFKDFQDSFLIQNPILESKFQPKTAWQNTQLQSFVNNSNFPTILIFGGGSGAKFMNDWVAENKEILTQEFNVVHLTGILQNGTSVETNLENFFSTQGVFEDMPQLLSSADFVLCRAGLGTISELEFLHKKAFLVPLPDSHQELNAELVQGKFVILEQKNSELWIRSILDKNIFDNKSFGQSKGLQDEDYYEQLNGLFS